MGKKKFRIQIVDGRTNVQTTLSIYKYQLSKSIHILISILQLYFLPLFTNSFHDIELLMKMLIIYFQFDSNNMKV